MHAQSGPMKKTELFVLVARMFTLAKQEREDKHKKKENVFASLSFACVCSCVYSYYGLKVLARHQEKHADQNHLNRKYFNLYS